MPACSYIAICWPKHRPQHQYHAMPVVNISKRSASSRAYHGKSAFGEHAHRTLRHDACRRLCALMGPSGSGKTTLLNALSGRALYAEIEGKILLDGSQLTKKHFACVRHSHSVRDTRGRHARRHQPSWPSTLLPDAFLANIYFNNTLLAVHPLGRPPPWPSMLFSNTRSTITHRSQVRPPDRQHKSEFHRSRDAHVHRAASQRRARRRHFLCRACCSAHGDCPWHHPLLT